MNEYLHNPKVANLQILANTFENNVIKGTKCAHDLNEFNSLYQELKDIIKQYKALFLETKESKYRMDYESYLAQEIDFLNLMKELMACLDGYHDVIGFVDGNEVQTEWDNAKQIILYRNIERQIAILHQNYDVDDVTYKGQYQALIQKYEAMRDKVIKAEAYIVLKATTKYNTMEVTTSLDKKQNFYTLDNSFYDQLTSLPDKISYIQLILDNIEQAKGKKTFLTYAGNCKEIATKHVWRYSEYIGLLNNLKKQYYLEEKELIQEDSKDLLLRAYQYASIVVAIYKLRKEALLSERVTNVTSIDGNEITILKTRLEKFQEIALKYQELKQVTPYLDEKSKFMYSKDIAEYEKNDEKRFDTYKKIQLIKVSGKDKKNASGALKILEKNLNDFLDGKRFVILSNMKALFKASNLPENISSFYTNIIANLDDFMFALNYSLEEKKGILEDILSKINQFIRNQNKEENIILSLPLLEDKNSSFLYEQIGNINEALGLIPKEIDNVITIKDFGKSFDKDKLRNNVKDKAASIAAELGMAVFVGTESLIKESEIETRKACIKGKNAKNISSWIEQVCLRVSENQDRAFELPDYDLGGKIAS